MGADGRRCRWAAAPRGRGRPPGGERAAVSVSLLWRTWALQLVHASRTSTREKIMRQLKKGKVLAVRAIGGLHVVTVAWDFVPGQQGKRDGLLGFAIERS